MIIVDAVIVFQEEIGRFDVFFVDLFNEITIVSA